MTYKVKYIKIDTWLEVNFTTFLSQTCEKQRVPFNNKCSIKACVKSAQTCQRLIIDYRVTVAIH